MHKIFRCSHLVSHYFSKTIVKKKRIVDIYLLKIFLGMFVTEYCSIQFNENNRGSTGRVKEIEQYLMFL